MEASCFEHIKLVMPKLGIKLINGSPYSPTSQGQVERYNKTIKCLLKKEIQMCQKSNIKIVENWSPKLLPRVIDVYIHTKHRSLSRTPWELYYVRSSPHPSKAITQFGSFASSFVESCSKPNNDTISNLESYDPNTGIRDHMDLQDRLTISSLPQTRKVQVENYRRIGKQKTSNLE